MDNALSSKHAHYAVPGNVISRLVRMIYILADREEKARPKLISLAKKLIKSPLIDYKEEKDQTFTLDQILEENGVYLKSDEEECIGLTKIAQDLQCPQ